MYPQKIKNLRYLLVVNKIVFHYRKNKQLFYTKTLILDILS